VAVHKRQNLVSILYEDDEYIVFDKPSGLLVIPTPKKESKTLAALVNQQYTQQGHSTNLHPCHRIDRDTSGAIVFAKGKRAQKLLMDLFKQRVVEKKYIAFVQGRLRESAGEFCRPIREIRPRTYHHRGGSVPAITKYKVVKICKGFSIVEVQPVTGRTNQIRIHFSQAGHPLVGDRKYAFARDYAVKFRRTALHAAEIGWWNPISHQKISVKAGLAKDMEAFLTDNYTGS